MCCDWSQPQQTGLCAVAATSWNAVGHTDHLKTDSESSDDPSDITTRGHVKMDHRCRIKVGAIDAVASGPFPK